MKKVEIRRINKKGLDEALILSWQVFLKYEAPEYPKEGIDEFYRSIHDERYLSNLTMFVAYYDGKLVGVIAIRPGKGHIALFFVDNKFQHRGLGKQLFSYAIQGMCTNRITVNASPFAVPIYHKLGFVDTDKEKNS